MCIFFTGSRIGWCFMTPWTPWSINFLPINSSDNSAVKNVANCLMNWSISILVHNDSLHMKSCWRCSISGSSWFQGRCCFHFLATGRQLVSYSKAHQSPQHMYQHTPGTNEEPILRYMVCAFSSSADCPVDSSRSMTGWVANSKTYNQTTNTAFMCAGMSHWQKAALQELWEQPALQGHRDAPARTHKHKHTHHLHKCKQNKQFKACAASCPGAWLPSSWMSPNKWPCALSLFSIHGTHYHKLQVCFAGAILQHIPTWSCWNYCMR